jgi:hypothetical protein
MRAEEVLLALEAQDPPVILAPQGWQTMTVGCWPLTPTAALKRYRRLGAAYLNEDVAEVENRLYLAGGGGWFEIVEAVIVDADPRFGPTFRGTAGVARTIGWVDDVVLPVPWRDEWLLAHRLEAGRRHLMFTCAFWLYTRHQAFLEVLAEMAEKDREATEEVEVVEVLRMPVLLAGSFEAPPDTPIQ